MNKKKLLLLVSALFALTVLPCAREYEVHESKNNLVDLWFRPNQDLSRVNIISSQESSSCTGSEFANRQEFTRPVLQQVADVGSSSSFQASRLHFVDRHDIMALSMQRREQVLYNAHMHFFAVDLMHRDTQVQNAYNLVTTTLTQVSNQVKFGTIHDRQDAFHKLNELRTTYDGLCRTYSYDRLNAARERYQNAKLGKYVHPCAERPLTSEDIKQLKNDLLILERNTLAVHFLASELNNLIDGLQVSLFHNSGGFVFKIQKNFNTLISDYQKQYTMDNRSMVEFSEVDQGKFTKINAHASNVAIGKINMFLASGNLAAAEQVLTDYNKTVSQRKYKGPVNECLQKNPYLNELGIPRICAETNPRWEFYSKELLAHPENKSIIAEKMYADLVCAQNVCEQAGVDNMIYENIKSAHQLLAYKNDSKFENIAYKALRIPNLFEHYLNILEQRNVALQYINKIAIIHPEASCVLYLHTDDLLCYASDPQFAAIINLIAQDPAHVQELKCVLVSRNNYIQDMQQTLGYENCTSECVSIAYQLMDMNNKQFIDDAFKFQLPYNLSTQEFLAERTCYTHVMLQPISSDLQREQAQQYLNILLDTFRPGEHQDAFRALSHIAAQTYLNPEMQTNEHMRQQNIALFNTITQTIHSGDITTAANNMNMLQRELQSIGCATIPIPEQVNIFIQQHVTLAVTEKQASSSMPSSLSSDIGNQHTVIDYAYLHDQTQTQHAAIFQRTGKKSDYLLSRENALLLMVQGDHAVQIKSYSLHQKALENLEKAGIDSRQFTECTGNLIQQDTHAKLVNAVNALADVRSIIPQAKLIKNGTIDCAQAGAQLNKEGHVPEAMQIADFCQAACDFSRGIYDGICTGASVWWHRDEAREHTLTAGSPSSHVAAETSADFTYFVLETAEIIARSAKGLVTGSYEGAQQIAPLELVQNLTNIAEHTVGRTSEFIQNGAHIEDCLLRGDRDGAERYYQANNALVSSAGQALQSVADTLLLIDEHKNSTVHVPHTPAEWESAAHSVGAYATKNIGEVYMAGQFFKGASKVAQGIAQNIRGFDQMAREVVLSAQLTGTPATDSLVQTIGRIHRIENVATHIGSCHISGIPALHPELVKRVLMNEGGQLVEVATQAIADGTSTAASHAATLLQLGKQLGCSLTEAKPGFIDLGGGEQQTTETNSSSSSSSSSGYVAATQEAAERTGQLEESPHAGVSQSHINPRGRVGDGYLDIHGLETECEGATVELKITSDAKVPAKRTVPPTPAEKAAQKELKAKMKPAENQLKNKNSQLCKEHGMQTSRGSHELTDVEAGLRDVIPSHLENEILAKPFDYTIQTHVHPKLHESINAARKPITFNYEHITPEFEVHCTSGVVSSKGFHHDYLGKIENSGFMEITQKITLPHDCYKFEWRSQGAKFKDSTMFPQYWTRAQTIEKIHESMMPANTKAIFYKEKLLKNGMPNNRYTHLGLTSEGIPVLSVIEVGERSAKVITAYPDFETYDSWLKGEI